MGMVFYEQATQLCCQLFRSLRKSVPLLYKLCCDSLQMGLFSTEQQCSFDVTPPPAAQLRYELALPPTSFKSCSAKVQHQPSTQRQHKRVTPHAVRQDLVKQSAAKRHVRTQLTLFQNFKYQTIPTFRRFKPGRYGGAGGSSASPHQP